MKTNYMYETDQFIEIIILIISIIIRWLQWFTMSFSRMRSFYPTSSVPLDISRYHHRSVSSLTYC